MSEHPRPCVDADVIGRCVWPDSPCPNGDDCANCRRLEELVFERFEGEKAGFEIAKAKAVRALEALLLSAHTSESQSVLGRALSEVRSIDDTVEALEPNGRTPL